MSCRRPGPALAPAAALIFSAVTASVGWAIDIDKTVWSEEKKSNHFIIYYQDPELRGWASQVLRAAERHYGKIADEVGYERIEDFWTWENRVRILAYPDQQAFIDGTGLPGWTRGFVARHKNSIRQRMIVTFWQEDGFLDGVLPHEIAHLVIQDYFDPARPVPLWFNEGLAQLQEAAKADEARRFMSLMLKSEKYLSFDEFLQYDIHKEWDSLKISTFYAQSVSLVDFLITRYGAARFRRLCRAMRDGDDFPTALNKSYIGLIADIKELEAKWVSELAGQ